MNGKILSLSPADDPQDDPVAETIEALDQLSFHTMVLTLLIVAGRRDLTPIARVWILLLIERILTRATTKAA